ncbi:EamA family transporter [Zunongwangia profunda]|uniref:EamA family transporter n=1 Tax=Zunongwangia profunda TaxID=398743 RepID=UPI001D186B9D|nr:EamA family transporter [Zunongwangia profunda]MBR9773716.1 EamA family transporter [Cytophagales bacterium]MCC4229961.1 EamA family transporter [Zunongwangia profunda]|tara:strand:- start:29734 stop:30636 length:903 start_codon:yes stop_codon:yes gene_type:complete
MNKNLLAYLSLIIVCLVWGSTYFAIRIGVATFPPFLFSAIRQIMAGGIMLVALKIIGKLQLRRSDLLNQSITGILMVTLGNGVIGWCERYITSGLAALILSLIPVFVVVISYLFGFDRRRPHILILFGLILGCLGIILIFRDNLKDIANPEYFLGMLIAFGACLAWASGSVFSKFKILNHKNVFQNAALQLLTGGIALVLFSLFLDDYTELKAISGKSIWALAYLIVFGSIIAYSSFVYALKHLPIGVSSLYAYINPFIAIMLGYFFLNEPLTDITLLALTATLSGVYCINRGYRKMAIQ